MEMLRGFPQFLRSLRIDTKDQGLVALKLLGSQKRLMREIRRGIGSGKRTMVVLKARQLGITTLCLAIDLFMHCAHPGLQGSLVADDDGNRDLFRSTLRTYMETLPLEYQVPVQTFNRYQMVLSNRSRCAFLVAGKRRNGGLGRGKAINYCHGTELSSWGDPEGFASLVTSFSERFAHRLYILESTARGFGNLFEELWMDAQNAVSLHPIFIGWWAREDYAWAPDRMEYRVYAGEPDAEEREWIGEVKRRYGVQINDRQLAWWRWYAAERASSRELAMQEMPWHADMAFIMGGQQFFDHTKLREAILNAQAAHPDRYSYLFGPQFADTKIGASPDGELRVWEYPVEGGCYVVGADPAYGASSNSDFHGIEVFRCYADGLDQVAELRVRGYRQYELAWAVAHLAGAYRGRLNLELNGPGMGVWQELQRMAQLAPMQKGGDELTDYLAGISHFFYSRADSLGGNLAYHTKTTQETKSAYMNAYRDCFERRQMTIRSLDLLHEMRNIRADEDFIGAAGRGKDDLCIATGLATAAYLTYELQHLLIEGKTRDDAGGRGKTPMQTEVDRSVSRLLSVIQKPPKIEEFE